jgi:hypothetical protein
MLHDERVRASVESRLGQLSKDSRPVWGRMTVDQMLWHVNQALGASLGQVSPASNWSPVPRSLMRFVALNLPWPRNSPTNKAWVAHERHDFDAELARCRTLVSDFVSRPVDAPPAVHPLFGQMSGRQQSHLHAKHLDHHLRQFGV